MTVILTDQDTAVKGILVDYTDTDLMISEDQKQDTTKISFERIEKVSLKEKEVPGPLFLLVIGLAFLIYQFGQEMQDLPHSN